MEMMGTVYSEVVARENMVPGVGTTAAQSGNQFNDYTELCYGETYHVEQYVISPI